MPKRYIVRFLPAEKVAQAFPLLQTVSEMSLDQWQGYANERLVPAPSVVGEHSGIVSVENDRGYIYGLFGYQVDVDLQCGRVLRCENLVALHMFDPEAVVNALVEAMESLAKSKKCRAVHVRVPRRAHYESDGGSLTVQLLRNAGHVVEAVELCKPLAPVKD